MKSEIDYQSKDTLVLNWSKSKVGYGQLTMKWDKETQRFILDSECMGIDTVIEIFKNLK